MLVPFALVALACSSSAVAHSVPLPLRRHQTRTVSVTPANKLLIPALSPVTDRTELGHLTAKRSLELFFTHHPGSPAMHRRSLTVQRPTTHLTLS